jgi:predicted transglutaminase-like cysteine proteinase
MPPAMPNFRRADKSEERQGACLFGAWCGRLILGVSMALAPLPAQSRTEPPALFGASEIRSDDLAMFTKWTAALDRAVDERRLRDAPCTADVFNRCHLAEWRRFLAGLEDLSRMAQLNAVNRYMNRKRYVLDPRNYGVSDYWAAPGQFLSRDGDCEDYAIAKFMSLKALGFTNDEMRIVVLQDLNLGIAHAVLAVYLNGRAMVLDNQIDGVVAADSVRHYRPIYSINERSWWLHRGGPEAAAGGGPKPRRSPHARYR